MNVSLLFAIGLIACGGTETEEKEVESAQLTDKETVEAEVEKNDENDKETDEEENEVKELNQEIIDNDEIAAKLVRVEKIYDSFYDEVIVKVIFEVKNKRDDTIEVQAREVSADGKMIDESMLIMSQEIASGKYADAVLTIQNYEGDLPEMEENLEMILRIFSWDDYEYENDIDVKIEF